MLQAALGLADPPFGVHSLLGMIWVCGTASGCLDDATSVGTQWTAQARGRGLQGRSLKNRPGNVHDSKQAVPFLRDIIEDLRGP